MVKLRNGSWRTGFFLRGTQKNRRWEHSEKVGITHYTRLHCSSGLGMEFDSQRPNDFQYGGKLWIAIGGQRTV